MPFLPPTLDELLRTGQVRVATRSADGTRLVLVTRFGIGGDILTEIERTFSTAPHADTVRRHQQAITGALQPLRRVETTLALSLNLTALLLSLLPPGMMIGAAVWQGGYAGLISGAWPALAWAGGSVLGALAAPVAFALVRRGGKWLLGRRIRRRFSTLAQGDTAPTERGAG